MEGYPVSMAIPVTSQKSFVALAQKDPAAAKQWLKEVASHSDHLLPATEIKALEQLAALSTDAFVASVGNHGSLSGLFAATEINVLNADQPADMPVLRGRLEVDRGAHPTIGAQGYREWPELELTLTMDDGRKVSLSSDNNTQNDIFTFVPGTDVMAFAGQDVSVRGVLDETGKTLRVTEFAPGKVEDFVSGRVMIQGDKVGVRARGRGFVEVTDPELKAELRTRANLGVILEGKTAEDVQPDGTINRSFSGKPAEYWMLVRFTAAPAADANGKLVGPIQAATNRARVNVEVTADQAPNIEVNDRMYVKGRFAADGHVTASKATTSAGSPWVTAKATRAAPMKTVFEFTEAHEPV